MTAAVLVKHPEVRGDDGVFEQGPVGRRQQSAESPNLAEARGAVNAGDHHIIAELGDADRGLAVEAAVPTEPIRLVTGGPLNALGVLLDGREQIVQAAAGERGGGQRHSAISGMIFLYPMEIGSTLPARRAGLTASIFR